MKKLFPFVLLAFVLSCGKKSGTNLLVSGTIKNGTAEMVYLEQDHADGTAPVIIDSSKVDKGAFRMQVTLQEESLLNLRADKSMYPFAQFINDNNSITVDADFLQPNQFQVSGSPASNKLVSFRQKLNEKGNVMSTAVREYQGLFQKIVSDSLSKQQIDSLKKKQINDYGMASSEMKSISQDIINNSESSVLALYVLGSVQQFYEQFGEKAFSKTEMNAMLDKLSQKFPSDPTIAKLKPKVSSNIAANFSLPDTSGKPLSLSSLKGKYVLVDFWASWCKPCREENPNVVAAWKQFSNKNFTILGVSLDESKNQWLNAIHSDSLTWNHVSDLKYWKSEAAELYNVRSIPYNFLVDPEGKIVAEDIRGQELFAALNHYLK